MRYRYNILTPEPFDFLGLSELRRTAQNRSIKSGIKMNKFLKNGTGRSNF